MKALPNIITYLRIFCSPALAVALVLSAFNNKEFAQFPLYAFWLFVIAASTDWLDGFLARALDAKSEHGAKLDLLADKLLVGMTIPAIIISQIIIMPNNFIILIASGIFLTYATSGRDYLVTKWREKLSKTGVSMPATFIAKAKTAVILIGISIFLGARPFGLEIAFYIGAIVTFLGALMSIYTGWQYYSQYKANKTI
jgi:cardiolipin synthase (CMP-forming)